MDKAIKALKELVEKASKDIKKEDDRRGDYTAKEVRRASKKFKETLRSALTGGHS